jgi:hypothetical protein
MSTANISYPDRFAGAVSVALDASLDLPDLRRRIARQARGLIERGMFSHAQRILLAGSGDSLFAASSVLPAFRRWMGLAVEAMTSLQSPATRRPCWCKATSWWRFPIPAASHGGGKACNSRAPPACRPSASP